MPEQPCPPVEVEFFPVVLWIAGQEIVIRSEHVRVDFSGADEWAVWEADYSKIQRVPDPGEVAGPLPNAEQPPRGEAHQNGGQP